MSILTDKVALVTGGSRSIGAAIAKRLTADVRGVMVATQEALKNLKSGSRIIMIGPCVG